MPELQSPSLSGPLLTVHHLPLPGHCFSLPPPPPLTRKSQVSEAWLGSSRFPHWLTAKNQSGLQIGSGKQGSFPSGNHGELQERPKTAAAPGLSGRQTRVTQAAMPLDQKAPYLSRCALNLTSLNSHMDMTVWNTRHRTPWKATRRAYGPHDNVEIKAGRAR